MRIPVLAVALLVAVTLAALVALEGVASVQSQGGETPTATAASMVYAPLILQRELLVTPPPTLTPIPTLTPTPTPTALPTFDPARTTVRLDEVVGGLNTPVSIANASDGSGRLFVVEKAGRIRIVRNGQLVERPFLDITSRVRSSGYEQGLLGLAFDPAYRQNGRFYVNYIDLSGNTIIARYTVSGDPDLADPVTESVVLHVNQPYENHNGGEVAFGPDGYLYLGLGDGGSGGDPHGNGQNLNTLLGKILRIDVSGASDYMVPPSNPFVGQAGKRGEIWAYGLRNPWRFAFDRLTGDLYIGDVGQNLWEEIDFQAAGAAGGVNYGWNAMEGMHCYTAGCQPSLYTLPVAEYSHADGRCSVTGGYVYRGVAQPALYGAYFFADFCNGQTWALQRVGDAWQATPLVRAGVTLSSFGEDEAGEVYVAGHGSGKLYRLVAMAR